MRSVILITSNNNEVEKLYQQWKSKATNVYLDNDKLNMVIYGERIYIDYLEDGIVFYEEDELQNINLDELNFYSIRYSSKEIMERFIRESIFNENSFLDNDMGKIIMVDKLKKEDISDFIE